MFDIDKEKLGAFIAQLRKEKGLPLPIRKRSNQRFSLTADHGYLSTLYVSFYALPTMENRKLRAPDCVSCGTIYSCLSCRKKISVKTAEGMKSLRMPCDFIPSFCCLNLFVH